MDQLSQAVFMYEKVLSIEPSDNETKRNLLELYLIAEQLSKYDLKYEEYKMAFTEKEGKLELINYFNMLREYIGNNNIKSNMQKIIKKYEDDDKKKRVQWDFEDIKKFISKREKNENSSLIYRYILFLEGEITKNDVILT